MSEHRDLQMQKVRDFREVFFKVISTHPGMLYRDAYKVAAESGAPRFYCTYEQARKFVSLIKRKRPLPLRQENKRRMYRDIYKKWKAAGHTTFKALHEIINSPAPSFYLSETTVMAFGHMYRKRK